MVSRVAPYRPAFWKLKNIVQAIKFLSPFDAAGDMIEDAVNDVKEAFADAGETIEDAYEDASNWVEDAIGSVGEALGDAAEAITNVFKKAENDEL